MKRVILHLGDKTSVGTIEALKNLSEEEFDNLRYYVNLHLVNTSQDVQTMLDYKEDFEFFDTIFKTLYEVLEEVEYLENKVDIGSIERLKYLKIWYKNNYTDSK